MWTCTLCSRSFKNNNQIHYCGDKAVSDFLVGKTAIAIHLFDHLISKFEEIGPVKLQATKSMIVISADVKFAYIITLGKTFVDVVFPFKELFDDNLCFRKMALVPGSNDYNHHLRIMIPDDINEEVFNYMKKVYANGKNL
ncbi:hypothetical protein FA048_01830 [Pedobacter polaris]|uniref:DUF5655 domain-containing protein n=1 Tax=Pedobacter polaris TaxID=2571273 RepID=A0A4U1CU84_9SPHI|nr:DUF5655 domain-containing protein [Pedobacter polaris]TKC12383.1 hypothetical protein FA048_01830 [Pedobacter polaris]